ncbi:hypothetical protein [Anaerostipes sp.]|uniref:hypothetical protein n=1 Tax=Anaerostipes sp. TaxID=1872530 RepID=UPI0025BE1147|nr:hypothetical protein [Anaerostipes sp.]MBS7007438.1 hypothetical protein [Anaerostipes sp.]
MPFRTYTQDFTPAISYDGYYSTEDFAQSILTLFATQASVNYTDDHSRHCLLRTLRAIERNLESLKTTGQALPSRTTSLLINGLPVYHETDTNHGRNNCSLFYTFDRFHNDLIEIHAIGAHETYYNLDCASDAFDTAVQALPPQSLWSYHVRGQLYAPQS